MAARWSIGWAVLLLVGALGRFDAAAAPAAGGDCLAAEQGDAEAAWRLGRRYLAGVGARRDRRLGVAWMRVAAAHGHAKARQVLRLVPGRWGRDRPWCRPGGAPARPPAPPPAEIVRLVEAMAPGFGLDPALVLAVIQVESAYRLDAVSPKAAAGLMQLIPETANHFGVRNVFDPEDNLRGGMKYLRWLLAYYQGDVTLALAAYNAGHGTVDRYRGVPPFDETVAYVDLIRRLYSPALHPFDPAVTAPSSIRLKR